MVRRIKKKKFSIENSFIPYLIGYILYAAVIIFMIITQISEEFINLKPIFKFDFWQIVFLLLGLYTLYHSWEYESPRLGHSVFYVITAFLYPTVYILLYRGFLDYGTPLYIAAAIVCGVFLLTTFLFHTGEIIIHTLFTIMSCLPTLLVGMTVGGIIAYPKIGPFGIFEDFSLFPLEAVLSWSILPVLYIMQMRSCSEKYPLYEDIPDTMDWINLDDMIGTEIGFLDYFD